MEGPRFARGPKYRLPKLEVGQPAFTTDTKELYIGHPSGNVKITGGSGSGFLSYNTLAELEAALPTGSDQPVWVVAESAWFYWDGLSNPTPPPPDTTAPNNVTNLAVSNLTATSLTLTWTASTSSDVASYDVYNGATLLGNVVGTAYNVTGLTSATAYTFTVKAKDASGNVATGASVSATTSVQVSPFYLANQSGTINWSQNTGTRGGGVKALKNMTITAVGAKGGASGAWSLWQLDNTTYNLTAKLAEGTTLAAPDGSGYRIASGLNIPVNANDNFLLCFTYATGLDASGTYRFQTGTAANADSSFTWNNRIVLGADGTPIVGHATDTGFTYDLVIYHT
jgi:hypothetical protein